MTPVSYILCGRFAQNRFRFRFRSVSELGNFFLMQSGTQVEKAFRESKRAVFSTYVVPICDLNTSEEF